MAIKYMTKNCNNLQHPDTGQSLKNTPLFSNAVASHLHPSEHIHKN